MKDMKREMTKSDANIEKTEIFVLRPYNHTQLAQFYGVSWLTFQRWIKKHEEEIGKKHGHFYTINQVVIIMRIFGIPKRFKLTMNEVEELLKQ
jgi:hypothetical protein